MFKRYALFFLTNIAVMVTIGIVTSLLGVNRYLTANGMNYSSLLALCFIWGFAGSFISLLMSKFTAKMMPGMKILDPKAVGEYRWLVEMVHHLARRANLPKMPDVGVYSSYEVNAFATGPSRSNSLVAVSEGLLRSMTKDEIEGVLAHEVAHIQNGDMVTMTLIQGVVNAFTMFLSRVLAFFISQRVEEEKRHMVQFVLVMVLDIVIGLLGLLVVCWFSRQREFRADKGSAMLSSTKTKMISALQRLGSLHGVHNDPQIAAPTAKISGNSSIWNLFMATHPPIEKRIEALESARIN